MFHIDTSIRGRDGEPVESQHGEPVERQTPNGLRSTLRVRQAARNDGPYYIHRERSKVVGMIYNEREREHKQVLLGFAKSIQERDIVTYDHSRRVANYAQRLARYLGWNRRDARDLALAGLVHDLGKTWIENDILLKSDKLSEEERIKMERHPIIGARILIGCDVHPFFVETVLYHHEAWNGRGYPTGLKGEEIPLSARILTVADVFDVLTSQRPYKAALSMEAARERLLQGSAASFDPMIVHAFLNLIDSYPNFPIPQRLCIVPTAEEKQLARVSLAGAFQSR